MFRTHPCSTKPLRFSLGNSSTTLSPISSSRLSPFRDPRSPLLSPASSVLRSQSSRQQCNTLYVSLEANKISQTKPVPDEKTCKRPFAFQTVPPECAFPCFARNSRYKRRAYESRIRDPQTVPRENEFSSNVTIPRNFFHKKVN